MWIWLFSVTISYKSQNKKSLDTTRFIKLHPEQHSVTLQWAGGHVISKTGWLQCVNSVDSMCMALKQCLRISLPMWYPNLFGDLFKLYSSEIAEGTFSKCNKKENVSLSKCTEQPHNNWEAIAFSWAPFIFYLYLYHYGRSHLDFQQLIKETILSQCQVDQNVARLLSAAKNSE